MKSNIPYSLTGFSHFFRGTEDGFNFPIFKTLHLILVLFWFSVILLIYFNRGRLRQNSLKTNIPKALAILLLMDQVVLYAWQFGSGYFSLHISLPLYHCRIATALIILAVLWNKKKILAVSLNWATVGSIIAMTVPDLYHFSFPHYTNFQFFIVHMTLGWLVCFEMFVKEHNFSFKELKINLIIINIYNVLLLGINLLLQKNQINANYGYLLRPPDVLAKLLQGVPASLVTPVMFLLYNFIIFLIWLLGRKLMALYPTKKEKSARISSLNHLTNRSE